MQSTRGSSLNQRFRRGLQWAALLVGSLILAELARHAGFSAAYLLGPMLCAVGFGVMGVELRVPRPLLWFSQAIIGCLVARSLTSGILLSIAHGWQAMLLVIGTTVLAGGLVGWVLVKLGTLPGSTAAWGSSPGAASAMVIMSGEFGADVRLVAFMQYLRVLLVVVTASVVSRLLLGNSPLVAAATSAPPPLSLISFAETLAIAVGGAFIAQLLKLPAGVLLLPLALGALFQATGLVEITLPLWVLHVAYVAVGWYVGLSFDRWVLGHAFRATPKLVLSTLLLIALCAVSAWLLTRLMRIDPLTAYLATSPGGLDSIAVIAAGSGADVPFVLAIQTMRLFVVILTGPPIARLISRYA
jgi:membrane AbrB-like protein